MSAPLAKRVGAISFCMVGTMPVLLLTTTGRKTEKKRTVPVMYLHEDPNYVITAPNKGRDKPPPKRLNLQSSPQAIIELGDGTRLVMAEQASSEEKRRLWAQLVEKAPAFDGYQKRTRREIPMIILCTK